ncbi:MAG: peptide deformylase, partial [Deltaproteobacteria bacterium]|nr:peptide deformylase [Deltaproteobacteria bacterium]
MKKVIYIPDPRLRTPCDEVTNIDSSIIRLVEDLKLTLIAEEGLGLAAPQIGECKRVFVFWRELDSGEKVIQEVINPKLKLSSEKIDSEEGCLSVPGYRDIIKRSANVVLTGFGLNSEEVKLNLSGLEARCAQHENDHL